MLLLLVHHGDAVGPEIDSRRPLSAEGLAAVERVAGAAAARGAKPAVVWHSGKLRAKQTAEAVWRACNALAEFSATRDLQPDDPPEWIRDRLRGEPRDIAIVGHFPHLPRLLALLVGVSSRFSRVGDNRDAAGAVEAADVAETRNSRSDPDFPLHGCVALVSDDEGGAWREIWRVDG